MASPISFETDRFLSVENYKRQDLTRCFRELIEMHFPGPATKQALGSLVTTSVEDVDAAVDNELRSRAGFQSYCNITEVDASGQLVPPKRLSPKAALGTHLWEVLQTTTEVSDRHRKAFGRLIYIHSVPPIVALQLLATLNNRFNVKNILQFFVRDKYGSSFICSPHIERPMPSMHEVIELPQYWCFTMKYYYFFYRQDEIYNGQVSGIFHEHDSEGEKIHRGSSVISLSLDTGGCPVWEYSKDARLPWRLLVLTCSKRRVEPIPLRNAIEAFLYAITCEMKNVHAQLYNLSARVAAIAVPSDDFLFDRQYRESLLFEDNHFTNSKTHFWALQALRTVNDCIADLIRNWRTFDTGCTTDAVRNHELGWLRRHMPNYEAVESVQRAREKDAQCEAVAKAEEEFETRLRAQHDEIDRVVERLTELKESNCARQDEIVALRDGPAKKLFNASTVLETRTTVLQGRNIQLLTYISMLFLPASFVTSLFGMEAVFTSSMDMKSFAMIFGLVCGLTYITILMIGFGGLEWITKKTLGRQSKGKGSRCSQPARKQKRQIWKIGRVRKLKRKGDAEKG